MKSSSPAHAGRILSLLVFSICINYIDRGALSVSAPLIAKELDLSPTRLGLLFSAFFWSYASFQIVAGWLVDRFPVKWVYAAGYLVWSLATAATGFIATFPLLLLARLVLGMGESVAYPACSKIIVQNFPETRRGMANALVDGGSKIGPGLSTLAGGLLVSEFGWRSLFIGVGLGSLLWLLPWILWTRADLSPDAHAPGDVPGMMEILSRREVWGTCLGMFALGYVWFLAGGRLGIRSLDRSRWHAHSSAQDVRSGRPLVMRCDHAASGIGAGPNSFRYSANRILPVPGTVYL
jgi:ACS family D-galactonate transporter-like MFS transporter